MSKAEVKNTSDKKIHNFCGKGKIIFTILGVILVIVVAMGILRGVNIAIEFKGGTMITYEYVGDIDANEVKSVVNTIVDVPVTVRNGESIESGNSQLTISFSSETGLTADKQAELNELLQESYSDNSIVLFSSDDVSASTGREFFLKSIIAVLFAALLIVLYIAMRFRKIGGWRAGVCSVFALLTDVFVAISAAIIFGFEINSNTIAVILTILGYSINNTIVIYDRIREKKQLMPKATMNEIINTGCTQSLTRSIRTSLTTVGTMLIVTIVVLVSGYTTLLSFTVPLVFGIISGTFTSLFLAPTAWAWWLKRQQEKAKSSKKK